MSNQNEKANAASLEVMLVQLGNEPLKGDARSRRRFQLLAESLWKSALSGDPVALRALLDRLPPDQVNVKDFQCPRCHYPEERKADSHESMVNVIVHLCKLGIFPPDLLLRFEIVQNPNKLITNEINSAELVTCLKKNLEQPDSDLAVADVILALVHAKRIPESVLLPFVPMLNDKPDPRLQEADPSRPQ